MQMSAVLLFESCPHWMPEVEQRKIPHALLDSDSKFFSFANR